MSIRIMSTVWDGYPGGGTDLLALLALANWSDDAGKCYPSIAAIARKTRLSRSQAQRIIHRLINEGFLVVTANALGGSPTQSRHYRIMIDRLTGSTDATPTGSTHATGSAGATGSTHAQEGSHPCGGRGSTHATQTVSEPSVHVNAREQARSLPLESNKKKSVATLLQFLEACKEKGEKPVPENDPIFDYAEKVGVSNEMLAVAWQEFKSAFLPAAKRQKDWRAHFRNAVRRNWYGLWFLKDGEEARWTTAGEQARRAAA